MQIFGLPWFFVFRVRTAASLRDLGPSSCSERQNPDGVEEDRQPLAFTPDGNVPYRILQVRVRVRARVRVRVRVRMRVRLRSIRESGALCGRVA